MQQGIAGGALAQALIKSGIANASHAQKEAAPTCQYCGDTAELVTGEVIYPRLGYLHHKHFWNCEECGAYVGCHEAGKGYGDGTRPLGLLANAELREAKKSVHAVFDPSWQSGKKTRKKAYEWLAEQLGIPFADCHVGMFTVEQCARAKTVCKAFSG
ncbi:zinc-finger-containing protein [Paraburkholderia sp. EG287A]|uniref:zinc-finger-containing protein n=1 Tax=Paraburkholderia sp. EG287A TaxID=3237012 RepID=UPI0034D169A5